jgi:hypothetical protein
MRPGLAYVQCATGNSLKSCRDSKDRVLAIHEVVFEAQDPHVLGVLLGALAPSRSNAPLERPHVGPAAWVLRDDEVAYGSVAAMASTALVLVL